LQLVYNRYEVIHCGKCCSFTIRLEIGGVQNGSNCDRDSVRVVRVLFSAFSSALRPPLQLLYCVVVH